MRLNRIHFVSLVAISTSFFSNSANATPVTGLANIAGNVTVSGSSINFMPTFESTGNATETGDFTGLTGGTMMSLSNGPVTGATSVPDFIIFSGLAKPIHFDLNYIAPGVGSLSGCGSASPGSSCTPFGSPFSLFQLSSNTVIAALQLNGVAYTGNASDGVSTATSIFSTQTVLNGNIPAIVSLLQSGQSLSGITFSASFQVTPPTPEANPVPEPATLLLLGLGLSALSFVARRKTSK